MKQRIETFQDLTNLILGMFKYLAEEKKVEKFTLDSIRIQDAFYKLREGNKELIEKLLFDTTNLHIAWSHRVSEIFDVFRITGVLEWDDKYYYIRAERIDSWKVILDKLENMISKDKIKELAERWYGFLQEG